MIVQIGGVLMVVLISVVLIGCSDRCSYDDCSDRWSSDDCSDRLLF